MLFWQKGPIAAKTGVISLTISITIVVGTAHCPAKGVNVYVNKPETFVSIKGGFHVPVIPLVETEGSKGGAVVLANRTYLNKFRSNFGQKQYMVIVSGTAQFAASGVEYISEMFRTLFVSIIATDPRYPCNIIIRNCRQRRSYTIVLAKRTKWK
jgi:hypothetical protein